MFVGHFSRSGRRVTELSLAAVIRQLADLADIRGVSQEAQSWKQLAADLESSGPVDVERLRGLARQNRLGELVALDPSLHWKLSTVGRDGFDLRGDVAAAGLPWLIQYLLSKGLVDTARAAALAREGIVTFADLELAFQDSRLGRSGGVTDSLRQAAPDIAGAAPKMMLGRAADLLDSCMLLLAAACPELTTLKVAGDVRRFEPLPQSLVVVGSAPNPAAVLDTIAALPTFQFVLHRTARRVLVVYQQTEIDVRIAPRDEAGTALFLATGAAPHVSAMRARQAAARLAATEEELYSQAGLSWIAPELRHGTGEIEAAAGTLPTLVGREHIRGDLHMHTIYSDGRDAVAEMVHACARLGYEYIAITDHSARSAAARTVTPDGLARQRDEIARLRDRFPRMTILHGLEVDIMPDGSLDFSDAVLEPLDIVLASLHDRADHDPARLTRRCLAAIRHPLVNVITHPANRLVGRDPGYDLDFPAIYEAAAATGTALEIDGAPSHLDLDGERAREAVSAGVTVTIDSDCHRAALLDRQMRLGIGTARRGWVEPRHVLNTRPLAEVRAFVAAKRTARL